MSCEKEKEREREREREREKAEQEGPSLRSIRSLSDLESAFIELFYSPRFTATFVSFLSFFFLFSFSFFSIRPREPCIYIAITCPRITAGHDNRSSIDILTAEFEVGAAAQESI